MEAQSEVNPLEPNHLIERCLSVNPTSFSGQKLYRSVEFIQNQVGNLPIAECSSNDNVQQVVDACKTHFAGTPKEEFENVCKTLAIQLLDKYSDDSEVIMLLIKLAWAFPKANLLDYKFPVTIHSLVIDSLTFSQLKHVVQLITELESPFEIRNYLKECLERPEEAYISFVTSIQKTYTDLMKRAGHKADCGTRGMIRMILTKLLGYNHPSAMSLSYSGGPFRLEGPAWPVGVFKWSVKKPDRTLFLKCMKDKNILGRVKHVEACFADPRVFSYGTEFGWKPFVENCEEIIGRLESETGPSSIRSLNPETERVRWPIPQPPLTSDIINKDNRFRAIFMLQFIIFSEYVVSNDAPKAKIKKQPFSQDQIDWVGKMRNKCMAVLRRCWNKANRAYTIDSSYLVPLDAILPTLLKINENWNRWRNGGSGKDPFPILKADADGYTLEEVPKTSKPRDIDSDNVYLEFGGKTKTIKLPNLVAQIRARNPEGTRIKVVGPKNLSELFNKGPNKLSEYHKLKLHQPTLEYFYDVLEQADPEAQMDDSEKLVRDKNFQWRALRILRPYCSQFISPNRNQGDTGQLIEDIVTKNLRNEVILACEKLGKVIPPHWKTMKFEKVVIPAQEEESEAEEAAASGDDNSGEETVDEANSDDELESDKEIVNNADEAEEEISDGEIEVKTEKTQNSKNATDDINPTSSRHKKIRFDDKDKDEHKTTSVVNGDEKPRAAKVSSKTTEVNKITDTPTKTKPEAKPTPSKERNAPLVQSSKRKIESNPTTSTDYDPSRSDKKEKSKVPRAARRSDSKTVGKDANLYDEITSSEDEDSAKTSPSKSRRTQKGKDNVTSEPIKSRENVKRPDRVVDIRRAKPEKRNIRIENEDRRASSAETKRNDNSRRNVTAPIRSYDRPAPRDVKESRRRPESPRSREMHAIKSRRGSADHARSGSERSRHYGR